MGRNSRARSATISRARGATYGLLAFLCLAVATATATDYAGANPKDKTLSRADEPMVVALAVPGPSIPSPAQPVRAPVISAPFTPAPAPYFTINEVLANRYGRALSGSAIQLASVDTGQTLTDAGSYVTSGSKRGNELFGLFTFVAPDGLLWTKWRKVEADIGAEAPILAQCLADRTQCSPAAARFSAIIHDARKRAGRAQLELVNQRVNAAIRYTNDMAQWGVADQWSAPLDTNNTGSLNTGAGDCEDFAIAKYVALREAGFPAGDLRVLLARENVVRMDHAVLAARIDGRWLILDNRYAALTEENDARFLTPLFALDSEGVKLFAASYAEQPAKGQADTVSAAPGTRVDTPDVARDDAGGAGSQPLLL